MTVRRTGHPLFTTVDGVTIADVSLTHTGEVEHSAPLDVASAGGSSAASVLYGAGAPSNGLGSDGDTYIDTAAIRLYGPKAAGAWSGAFLAIGGGAAPIDVLFHEAGSATVATSDPHPSPAAGALTKIRLVCRTAPVGSDLVVVFKNNGLTIGTLTIPAGSTTAQSAVISKAVVEGDLLTVQTTSVGSDTPATGVVAQVTGTVGATAIEEFDPDSIAGLRLWMEANTLGLADGAAVASWLDQSASAVTFAQATAGSRPTYRATGLGGLPSVEFANDFITTTGLTVASGPKTVIAVLNPTTLGTDSNLFDSQSGRFIVGPRYGGGTSMGFFDGAAKTCGPMAPTGVAQIITWKVNSGANVGTCYRNGTSNGTNTAAAVSIGGPTAIGARFDGSSAPYNGHLACLLVYDTALSDLDRSAVEHGLGDKYGITVA